MENLYRPRVLMVHNFYQVPGGEDTVFYNEKKLLEDNDHEVITYTRNNKEINNFSLLEKICYPLNTIFSLKTYNEVKKIILDNQIDIVHVHNTWPLISPSIFYASFHTKIPVVQTIHNFRLICPGGTLYHNGKIYEDSLYKGLWSSVKNKVYKNSFIQTLISALGLRIHRMVGTYKKVNYIFLTEFNKNKVLELNNRNKIIIDNKKVYIKPNFAYEGEKKYSPKDYYIFVGRLEESKGIQMLIETFEQMPEKKLVIVGTGALESRIKKKLEEKDIKNITLLGYKPKKTVNKIMGNAKALIICSQLYETFGMVIIEAYSNGVPVIAGNIGNLNGLVVEEQTGLKFTFDSVEDLKKTIYKFETMNSNFLGENAYNFFLNNYSSQSNYEILYSIYKSLIE